ncbi:MAG: hypothetical protein GWN00_10230 [Aliifodinibius sp.]|nr:hypothetical protein [Fodinibius sp.]NIY25166.1 hypothetical protein [Fodinibius sp.]
MESRKVIPYIVGLTCLGFLLFTGCKDKPIEPDFSAIDSETEGFTPLTKTREKDQIYQELDKIAKFLAKKRNSIASSLPAQVLDRKGEDLLNQLTAARSLQTRFVGSDGRIFEVTFALAKKSPVNNLAKQLRVAVDPDDYPTDESGNFTVYFWDNTGKLVSETTKIETYNQQTPYPLLLVNTFEEVPVRNSLSKPNSGNSTTDINSGPYYLSVRAIDLKRENDPIGYEEFEIYVREESIPATIIDCGGLQLGTVVNVDFETDWLFNGGTRNDAMGRSRKFYDINVDDGGWIYMDQDIALVYLDSEKKGLTPIEDDYHAGEHHNHNTELCGPDQYYWYLRVQKVTAYRWDLGKNQEDDVKFSIGNGGEDDVYSYSGIFGVNQSNCEDLINTAQDFPNTDMDMRLLVEDETGPPPPQPPDPPVVQGSVVNGHPKLTWEAVSGADYYKVTLVDTYASQTLNWTVYTTSFEDPDRYPVVIGGVFEPSLTYTVKTVDNDLESDPSNAVVYQYE